MKRMVIEAAEQRVVILPEDQPNKMGSIYIPDSVEREKPRFGTIVSAGFGNIDTPMKYKVGDRVMFSQYSGVEVELNLDGTEKKYLVMNQIDIMLKAWEV